MLRKQSFWPCIIAAGTFLAAFLRRFVLDDAFISYRYAENFVAGHGLVFNAGEAVEGYTNFLWTVLHIIPIWLGLDVIHFSWCLGLGASAVTMYFMAKLLRRVVGSESAVVCGLLLLGTNYSFIAYSTSGLETAVQTGLITVAAWLALTAEGRLKESLWFSLVALLALLTRLDSAILLFPLGLLALFGAKRDFRAILLSATALVLPCLLGLLVWGAWKMSFYGEFLPNTFYAKVHSRTNYARGLYYVYMFFVSYWLLPLLFIGIFSVPRLWRHPVMRFLSLAVCLWLFYLLRIGGDFMEFRFMVPALPIMMLLGTWALYQLPETFLWRRALLVLSICGSLNHAITFGLATQLRGMETISQLAYHTSGEGEDWSRIGQELGRIWSDGNVTIATTAAGAIPYYSKLPSIDLHGLSDKFIARHGKAISTRPGHGLMAPLSYLLERHVQVLIGHPLLITRTAFAQLSALEACELMNLCSIFEEMQSRNSELVLRAIPLWDDQVLVVVVLDPRLPRVGIGEERRFAGGPYTFMGLQNRTNSCG